MFIERSESRIRSARAAFLFFCLLPSLALAAWAWHRSGDAHRHAACREWGRELGLTIDCDRIEHLRPGCVRLSKCRLGAPGVGAVLEVVEVEVAAEGVRVRVPHVDADPDAIRVLGVAARSWLDDPSRSHRAWLIDVADARWRDTAGRSGPRVAALPREPAAIGGLRIECVPVDGSRGIRIRREPATDEEIRIVRSHGDVAGELVVEARVDAPVPLELLGAMLGLRGAECGGLCSGKLSAVVRDGAWSGTASVVIDGLDASSIPRGLDSSLVVEGNGRLDVAHARFEESAIAEATATLSIRKGECTQDLLDRLVQVARCRAGTGYRPESLGSPSAVRRSFADAEVRLRIDRAGVTIRGADVGSGALLSSAGSPLLLEPLEPVPCEDLLWVFASRGDRPVPATPATAWLVPLLPKSGERRPR